MYRPIHAITFGALMAAVTDKAGGGSDGFNELDMDIEAVRWEDTESIEGKVLDTDVFHSEKGDKRVLIVSVNGKPLRLIEQPGLRRLFEKATLGDTIRVQVNGWRDLGDNQRMRVFKAAIKPGGGRSPHQQSTDREMRDARPSRQARK